MFSELVDSVVLRSRRPDRQGDAIAYANMTVRELCGKAYLAKNLIEDQIIAGSTDPLIWPRPPRLQKLRTIRYADGLANPPYIPPSKAQFEVDRFYYSAADYYALKGATLPVDVAYYQFPTSLKYFAVDARPAVFEFVTETWTYLPAYDVDAASRLVAQSLVANWVLRDWYELVQEGILAKLFKLVADTTRAGTHFSFYERMRDGNFMETEAYEPIVPL